MNTGIRAKDRLMTKAGVLARAAGLAAVLAAGGCWNLIMQQSATVRFVSGDTVVSFESAVGADFDIPPCTTVPEGQAFNGWETENGDTVWPGTVIKVGKTIVTFTAKLVTVDTVAVKYWVAGALLYERSYPYGDEVRVENVPGLPDNDGNGNVFLGWLPEGGTRLAVGELLSSRIQKDVRLDAVYGAQPLYKVTYFKGDSASGREPEKQEGLPGVFTPADKGYLSKGGYLFCGWKDTAGAVYLPGAEYRISRDLFLSPIWLKACHISYGKAFADSGEPPENGIYPEGTEITLPDNTGNLFREGFAFGGWKLNSTLYAPGYKLTVSGDLSFEPQWADGYHVWYNEDDAESGTAPEDPALYAAGTKAMALGNTGSLERAGYRFNGWKDLATGILYAVGDKLPVSGNVTLAPVWQKLYRILYDKGDAENGTAPEDPALYAAGTRVTALGNTGSLARAGYLFTGWQDAAGTVYAPGDAITTASGDLQLTSAWEKLYRILYDKNGADSGTAPEDAALYLKGAEVTVQGNVGTLRRVGFVFDGWSASPDGTGALYTAGSRLAVLGDTTLCAVWREQYRTVTFNANGGSPTPDAVSVPNGGTLGGNMPADPAKEGMVFLGWFAEGSGAEVFASTLIEEDVPLFAKWGTPITSTLVSVYQVGGGENGTTGLLLTFDKVIPGLSADDITLVDTGNTNIRRGELAQISGSIQYMLSVSGITANGSVTVRVSKRGLTLETDSLSVQVLKNK